MGQSPSLHSETLCGLNFNLASSALRRALADLSVQTVRVCERALARFSRWSIFFHVQPPSAQLVWLDLRLVPPQTGAALFAQKRVARLLAQFER